MELEDFLAHHGVKGMHWGVRRSRTSSADHVKELNAKATAHEETGKALVRGVENLKTHQADLAVNGHHSDIFKQIYGEHGATSSATGFFLRNGVARSDAIELTRQRLVNQRNANIHAINRHAKRAGKLRAKAAKATKAQGG